MSTYEPNIINACYPVYKASIYDGVCKVHRRKMIQGNRDDYPQRGKIKKLSSKSLNRLIFLVRSTRVEFKSMMTLTYGETLPATMQQSKLDLKRTLQPLKKYFGCDNYVWCLEFQKRGAPHYHLLLDVAPGDDMDRRLMAGLWASAMKPARSKAEYTKIYNVHRHPSQWVTIDNEVGAKKYLTSYVTKIQQKLVPSHYKGAGRFWGASKGVKPDDPIVADFTEDELRDWLELQGRDDLDRFEILPKFIWIPYSE